MQIESITLRKLKLRLKSPFEISFGITHDRNVVPVELFADGLTGWAEVTASEGPFFNSETVDTAWLIIRGFLVPLILGKEIRAASHIPSIFAAIRGHEMARAGVENALWDVEAQQKNLSPNCSAARNRKSSVTSPWGCKPLPKYSSKKQSSSCAPAINASS